MSNDLTTTAAQLPAHLQGVVGQEVFEELSGGVSSGFPVISYKGKVWKVRAGGETQPYLNADGDPMPSLEVVMLRSNNLPSKTYYKGSYSEGDNSKPDCWSSDGVRPDSTVPVKVNDMCANCPMNVWGSKQTDQGKPTKACQDVRRVAVAFLYQLEEVAAGTRALADVDVMLLRVPPASLNPLKDYAERVLKPKGIPYYVLATKIGFDADAAYPKFTFKGLRFLNEDEFKASAELRESDEAKRVLNESAEYADAGTTGTASEAGAAPTHAAPEVAAPAPAKATPVQETAVAQEQAAAKAETVDEIAPAPAPVAPPEVPASNETPSQPAAASPSSGGEDFDAMLDSILGG